MKISRFAEILVFVRTAIVILLSELATIWCLYATRDRGQIGADIFHYAAFTFQAMALIAAGHSALQHATDGTGIISAFKNMLTPSKPPDPNSDSVNVEVTPPAEIKVEKKL